jgi:hypothetical protein
VCPPDSRFTLIIPQSINHSSINKFIHIQTKVPELLPPYCFLYLFVQLSPPLFPPCPRGKYSRGEKPAVRSSYLSAVSGCLAYLCTSVQSWGVHQWHCFSLSKLPEGGWGVGSAFPPSRLKSQPLIVINLAYYGHPTWPRHLRYPSAVSTNLSCSFDLTFLI